MITIIQGDCRETLKTITSDSVHCCVTSPPYYGLRDYGCEGQIGLEASPAEYVQQMVDVFREVRRVLRQDGTLWLNIGDSYAGSWGAQSRPDGNDLKSNLQGASMLSARQIAAHPKRTHTGSLKNAPGLKPKDLMGIPWRVAFALQEDGWWLRQEIIWHKPNPMPESVNDRCTKAHEQIFLLAKSDRYYFDSEAIKEDAVRGYCGSKFHTGKTEKHHRGTVSRKDRMESDKRNRRSVWTVSTKPYRGAHFATFPPDLIEPCILAGTSEEGCCSSCGAPWVRITEKDRVATRPGTDSKVTNAGGSDVTGNRDPQRHVTTTRTIGWRPQCTCESPVMPCTVLDPFNGSGTTGFVARKNGLRYIGCEINPEYIALTHRRLEQERLF